MEKYCLTCKKKLELCKGEEPWNTNHMICTICNGTYNIFELEKCECKYAHQDGICRWPTLEGRFNHPVTSEKEALLQLHNSYKMGWISMSVTALKKVEKYIKQDKKLQATRKKVQAAVDAQPKSVTYKDALKQVKGNL